MDKQLPHEEIPQIPFGVKYLQVINAVHMCLFVAIGILLVFLIIDKGQVLAREQGTAVNLAGMVSAGIIAFSLCLIPVFCLAALNRGLGELSTQARFWQVIAAVVLIFEFPLGTVLYGLGLYFILGDAQTVEAFEEEDTLRRLFKS